MPALAEPITVPVEAVAAPPPRTPGSTPAALTLARRRFSLAARTPRELLIPLLAPLLFAVVVAPALADTVGRKVGGVDYMTFVAVATIGLLVPLSCIQAGLGSLVDRLDGGLRDLLAAPVSRSMIVVGNLLVAIALSVLQVAVLLIAVALRGAEFNVGVSGVVWFSAAVVFFTVAMYGVAEVLANKLQTQEEYIGALPPVAIVPFFFAGSFFSIAALPAWLTAFAKVLPITHLLALMRYGLVRNSSGLRDIWGMNSASGMAALSLGVIVAFAGLMTVVSMRVFQHAAVK